MRSTFDGTVFQHKSVSADLTFLIFVDTFWRVVLGVSEEIFMDL